MKRSGECESPYCWRKHPVRIIRTEAPGDTGAEIFVAFAARLTLDLPIRGCPPRQGDITFLSVQTCYVEAGLSLTKRGQRDQGIGPPRGETTVEILCCASVRAAGRRARCLIMGSSWIFAGESKSGGRRTEWSTPTTTALCPTIPIHYWQKACSPRRWPISNSISRLAANAVMSRTISTSGMFSINERKCHLIGHRRSFRQVRVSQLKPKIAGPPQLPSYPPRGSGSGSVRTVS